MGEKQPLGLSVLRARALTVCLKRVAAASLPTFPLRVRSNRCVRVAGRWPDRSIQARLSVLIQSTALNIRIAPDSRTPYSFARMHFEFYRVLIEARATNSSNLESKSFRIGDWFNFCSRGPDRRLAYLPSEGDSLQTKGESSVRNQVDPSRRSRLNRKIATGGGICLFRRVS